MGLYRFSIPDSDRFCDESIATAQIVGLDGVPYPGKNKLEGSVLSIRRNTHLSGRLLIPFSTGLYGDLSILSGTLPESEKPYDLLLELARGSLSRLRNQASIWQEGGLNITSDFAHRLEQSVHDFSSVIFQSQSDQRNRDCERIIDMAVKMMFEITNEFSRQIAQLHHSQPNSVPVIAGAATNEATIHDGIKLSVPRIQRTADPEVVDPDSFKLDWSSTDHVIGWASDDPAETVRIVGPVLAFDKTVLPDWMPTDATFEQRLATARNYCRQFAARYQKQIKILHVTSGISGVGHQYFNYPQQLQMTLEMLETLDQTMPNTSMMVSFDQPWGERLSMATGGVQAMEITDSLLRYGSRVSAIGLEFNLDYWPQGTLIRDPLQWVDLIDRWSQFGLPLAIYLSAPTGEFAAGESSRFARTIRGKTDTDRHRQYVTTVFNLLVRRPAVNAVAWRNASNHDNFRFPLSGLCTGDGQIKEADRWFSQLVADIQQNP